MLRESDIEARLGATATLGGQEFVFDCPRLGEGKELCDVIFSGGGGRGSVSECRWVLVCYWEQGWHWA